MTNANSGFHSLILAKIENRPSSLIETETMNEAPFLDLIFRRLLPRNKKDADKTHLEDIVR